MAAESLGNLVISFDIMINPKMFYLSEKSIQKDVLHIYENGISFSSKPESYRKEDISGVEFRRGRGVINIKKMPKIAFSVISEGKSLEYDRYNPDAGLTKSAIEAIQKIIQGFALKSSDGARLSGDKIWSEIRYTRPLFLILVFVICLISIGNITVNNMVLAILTGSGAVVYIASYVMLSTLHKKGKDLSGIWLVIYRGVLIIAGIGAAIGYLSRKYH